MLSIAAWIAAVVYYKVDNARGKKHWDIWSWSCTHETWNGSKVNFEPLCIELVRLEIHRSRDAHSSFC
jgi:hypothetical protein